MFNASSSASQWMCSPSRAAQMLARSWVAARCSAVVFCGVTSLMLAPASSCTVNTHTTLTTISTSLVRCFQQPHLTRKVDISPWHLTQNSRITDLNLCNFHYTLCSVMSPSHSSSRPTFPTHCYLYVYLSQPAVLQRSATKCLSFCLLFKFYLSSNHLWTIYVPLQSNNLEFPPFLQLSIPNARFIQKAPQNPLFQSAFNYPWQLTQHHWFSYT